jgi:transcriptional regulator with GAF, ATPase, and Fis domain/Flp pilus assembly protein TadD
MKSFQASNVVTNVLIDNFQNCDDFSKRLFLRLFQQAGNSKILFLVSSDGPLLKASEFGVHIPIHRPPLKLIQESIVVPFWQEKQRRNYFDLIYQRTSGNPLFFHEYLSEALRTRQSGSQWNDGEWSFQESVIPDFPAVILDFYWNSAPHLNEEEIAFLEIASLKGELFDCDSAERAVLESLIRKDILVETNGKYRFRKQLFAEAIKKRLEPERRKQIHLKLAGELSAQVSPDSMISLADHYLQAGEASAALDWTCRAIQELGDFVEPSALSLLNELDKPHQHLTVSEKILLCRRQGSIFFRRGNFPHAAASFKRAMEFATEDQEWNFQLGLQLLECQLLQEDIVSAQQTLAALARFVPQIQDDRTLFHYYIGRAVCSRYSGPRSQDDFQKAFSLAESLADDSLLAYFYRKSAWLSLKELQLTDASRFVRKALRHARMARDTEETGHCYKILASVAWRKSNHDQAEKMMKRGIRAFQKIRNEFGCAGIWNLLGNVYVEKYKFSDAARCFERAVTLFGHLDHPREVSLAQFNMGLVYLEQGKLKEAEKIFLRCRAMDRASGNKWFYAYDLRALAVYCILQGYARKATRLLKRTIEICEELKAKGDVLQTRMILLFHHLEQENYRDARAHVSFLEERMEELQEPLTKAEIHHLLAYYYGFLQEKGKANKHLKESLAIGRRIKHYKLIGKNLIFSLIFRGKEPRHGDPELKRAIANFRKSRNQLEFADYLLKLYQAYPSLAKEKSHWKRIRQMDSLYRQLRIRNRHRAVRNLLRSRSSDDLAEPLYERWRSLLSLIDSRSDLHTNLISVLRELNKELHATYGQIQYLDNSGTFERVWHSDQPVTNTVEDLPGRIFQQVMRQRESLCMDIRSETELSGNACVVLNGVRSVLAVPFLRKDELLGLWYFERRGNSQPFSARDLQKLSFFSMACQPLLEKILERDRDQRITASPVSNRFQDMIGISSEIQRVGDLIEKVAPLDVSVLIQGESGTGKELVARNIHRLSKRNGGPFVALNCSAIPETLIESELFGHAKGAFTGAVSARPGSVERAQRGTLFLDEIGDLSSAAQAKLLRVIQEREVQRLGETSVRKIDVRFLFATHKNIDQLVRDGAYREDLFYRISGYTLSLPPLRERKEDIPILIRHFLEKYSREFSKDGIHFSRASMKMLCDYSWPGNVREMENVIQTVLVNSDPGSTVDVDALPRKVKTSRWVEKTEGLTLDEGRQLFEREFLLQALTRNAWNKSRTAKELKVTRQGLINMIQRLGLEKRS